MDKVLILQTLAALYLEKKMNAAAFEATLIPRDTYEKVYQQIAFQTDKLEKLCYQDKTNNVFVG